MLPKRPFHDGGDENEQGSKRFKNAVKDNFANFSIDDFVLKIEPYLRAIVREAVEETVCRVFQQSSRSSSSDQPKSIERRGFLLDFVDQVPTTIFTNTKIATEDGNSIQVVLLDANTNSIVTSGPLSSMKLAVVALDGDFGSDDLEEDWSENEFVAKVIRKRDGRRPLVTGELTITLKDGVGRIGNVSFSDNSSWIRCRKFRLGILPLQNNYGDVRIREARSGAFVVKDQRGESYKKHYPPHQNDDIWRLVKIARDGVYYGRLVSNGIHKVKDLLQFHATDPSELRKMFEGISNKTWDTIIGHASTCSVDYDELYIYNVPGQCIALLFNSIYKLIGVAFDGQNYEQIDKLSINQTALVENWKGQAYKNTQDFIRISALAVFGTSRPLTVTQPEPLNDAEIWMQQLGLPIPCQDQPYMQLELDNSSISTSYPFEEVASNQFELDIE